MDLLKGDRLVSQSLKDMNMLYGFHEIMETSNLQFSQSSLLELIRSQALTIRRLGCELHHYKKLSKSFAEQELGRECYSSSRKLSDEDMEMYREGSDSRYANGGYNGYLPTYSASMFGRSQMTYEEDNSYDMDEFY